jgi:hypothetical protein
MQEQHQWCLAEAGCSVSCTTVFRVPTFARLMQRTSCALPRCRITYCVMTLQIYPTTNGGGELEAQHEVEHMCDVLLGRYMYAACNNTIYSSSNGANACSLHYYMGVLSYTFRAFSKRNAINQSLSIDQRTPLVRSVCMNYVSLYLVLSSLAQAAFYPTENFSTP